MKSEFFKPKIHFIITTFLVMMSVSCSNNNPKLLNTTLSFDKNVHDFGTIASKQYVSTSFKFTNTGDSPVMIEQVKTTCGCTVPEWPKEKISSNGIGEILIRYDANNPVHFNKTIIVYYNGEDSPKNLKINGQAVISY